MVGLPCIERSRWHEQRTVAFDDVNFRIKTRYDARGQQGRHGKGVVGIATEFIDPEDAVAFGVDQFHRNKISLAVAAQMAGRNILRVYQGGCRRGGKLRSEKAVPRAMTLKLRNLAKPKMMSLVTLSASAALSGAAVNGSKSRVGPRVSPAGELDGASKRAVSIKLTTAGFEVDRRAAAKAASSDFGSMPSVRKRVTDASIWRWASA